MADRRLALATYRGLLRFGRHSRDVPYQVRASDLQDLGPAVHQSLLSLSAGCEPVTELARLAFRQNKGLEGQAAQQALDHGLTALRIVNTEYAGLVSRMRELRADRADRSGLPEALRVGQVVAHRKFGYRGVIYGWDRTCDRDEEWCAAMGVRHDQPFFYVLPDETDCIRLFGAVRISKYVARDNLEPLGEGRVLHRGLGNYFSGYSQELMRYVPSTKLAWEYPSDSADLEDVHAAQAAGLEADTNLLLHPEVEPPARPAFKSPIGQAQTPP